MIKKIVRDMYVYREDSRYKLIAIDEILPHLVDDEATPTYASKLLDIILSLEVRLGYRTYANLFVDEIFQNGVPLPLTSTEKQIVLLLAERKGRLVTYEELIKEVWGYAEDNSILKVNISNIRNKTDLLIISIKGQGYVLKSVS